MGISRAILSWRDCTDSVSAPFLRSIAHTIEWHRVVLDEAHNIKDRQTNVAKACFALNAQYRWCLSGTPLQNRVGELYSLVRFLGGDREWSFPLSPPWDARLTFILPLPAYSYYFCKKCPCKSLHWQFSNRKNCDECGHSPMGHVCLWNNEILNPIVRYGTQRGEGLAAWRKLKVEIARLRKTEIVVLLS